MSVVYPKRNAQKATIQPPATGIALSNACATAAVLFNPMFQAPVSRIVNAEHVRFKESDRIASTVKFLKDMGADIEEKKDGCVIRIW